MNPSVLNTVCVVVITLILSYFSLIFGELVPKRIAMQKTEAVARAVSGVIFGFATITRPIVWLLSVSTNGVLRLLRIDPTPRLRKSPRKTSACARTSPRKRAPSPRPRAK